MKSTVCYMIYSKNKYWHEGNSPFFCKLFHMDGEIHKVEITENNDDSPKYYAFWDNSRNRFINVWYTRSLVEMCYPYGTKVLEKNGEGKLMGVDINFLEKVE